MKIKRLILRNIASIEAADIDFENGLNDLHTGEPASIFLISGDTGAGKSVILDGISMALYKKTPRIEGVAGKQNNKYRNEDWESVDVFSIEQYTRLGIAPKTPCFSHLVFEGNDGILYHARLSLGVYLKKRNKEGKRLLDYETPKWEYSYDGEDWMKVEANGEPIRSAVGLSFEQFGRMAMLAQGQFASFLTGNKTEREAILEQLTNTEIFTKYGKAIENLKKTADAHMKASQKVFDTESTHILPAEKLDEIHQNRSALEEQKTKLQEEHTLLETRRNDVAMVLNHHGELAKAVQQKEELEQQIAAPEYLEKQQLVADWDTTTTARKNLEKWQEAAVKRQQVESALPLGMQRFERLAADLAYREEDFARQERDLHQLQQWLEGRASQTELYGKSQTIVAQLKQFEAKQKDDLKERQQLSLAQGQVAALKDQHQKALAAVAQAEAVVKQQQAKIERITEERNALHPIETQEKSKQVNADKQDLLLLQRKCATLENEKQQLAILVQEVEKGSQVLLELEQREEVARRARDVAKASFDKEKSMLSTMEMSLDQKLRALRLRLHNEHTENCPLCGQKIVELHLDDDFQEMLSPLKAAEDRAKSEWETAEAAYQKVFSETATQRGTLASKSGQKAEKEAVVEQLEAEVKQECLKLEISSAASIEHALQQIDAQIEGLQQTLKEAETLLRQITLATAEKQPLDEVLTLALQKVNEADHQVKVNDIRIADTQQRLGQLAKEVGEMEVGLEGELRLYFPTWKENLVATQQQLTQEAKIYLQNEAAAQKQAQDLSTTQGLLLDLRNLHADIVKESPDWERTTAAAAFPCENIRAEWSKLFVDLREWKGKIAEAEAEQKETAALLEQFYAASGKTEESLSILLQPQTEQKVMAARDWVTDMDNSLNNCQQFIHDVTKKIEVLLKKLGIASFKELPPCDELEQRLAELKAQSNKLTEDIGALKQQLDTHEANVQRVAQARNTLELARKNFSKWDALNNVFGGTRFRNLVQTHILRPLLDNANLYLSRITDRYTLTCSPDNEQLSILVLDRYNKDQVRSVTVLSGGERFMISLALSLSLSSLNRPDMNVNMLFIDEGFGTLDEKSLDSVMATLEKLQDIAGESQRRVGIISHREEIDERIPTQIRVVKRGEGRSQVVIK